MKANRNTAGIAGFLYLLQIPFGTFGILYIPKFLVSPTNISTTISNILANELLYKLSIVSAIFCAIITVGTSIFIYKVLKVVDMFWSKAIAIFALLAAPISILNELNNIAVLILLKNHEVNSGLSVNEIQSLVLLFLKLHEYGMQLIGIFFGLWLFPMGYLVVKSNFIPKIIGILLIITCLGYLIDFTTFLFYPDFKIVLSEYTWLGEVLMVLWLLYNAITQSNQKRELVERI